MDSTGDGDNERDDSTDNGTKLSFRSDEQPSGSSDGDSSGSKPKRRNRTGNSGDSGRNGSGGIKYLGDTPGDDGGDGDRSGIVTFDGTRFRAGTPKTEIPSLGIENKKPTTRKAATKKGDVLPEDEEDIALLVSGLYAGAAAYTHFEGWKLSQDETEQIARPAARILARHKNLQKTVRQVADPAALAVAVIVPTLSRFYLWQEYIRSLQQNSPQNEPPQQNYRTYEEPASTFGNGLVATPDTSFAEPATKFGEVSGGPAAEATLNKLRETW